MSGTSATTKLNHTVAQIIARNFNDPLGFVMEIYPWGVEGTALADKLPRKWQVQVLEGIRHALEAGEKKIYIDIASGHGIGKSALIAWVNQFMILRSHCRGIITANTQSQLTTKTMPEMNKWFSLSLASSWMSYSASSLRRVVGGATNKDKFQDWRVDALPWVKEKPDAFGGLHNDNGSVCVTFDEASGIPKVIWETIDGAMSDSDSLMIFMRFGNPLRNVGAFADLFRKPPTEGVYTIRMNIDSRDVEGTDVDFINAKIAENGGEDSDYAKSRWRGVFPDQSDWQLIDTKLVDGAMRIGEPHSLLSDPICMGIDFARGGPDKTVCRLRKGRDAKSFPSRKWDRSVGKDSMELASQISAFIDETKPHYIFADCGGIGGPIIDRLRQLGHTVIAVDAGSASSDKARWHNKRAEIWCRFRDWLVEGGALPAENTLREQIIQQEYFFRPDTNAYQLVSKEDMRDDGLESPDDPESLIQTFAHPVAPLHDHKTAAGRSKRKRANTDYNPLSALD
jgi:hypothetical protein